MEGKRYLDCLAAYFAVNQGHCHPRLLKVFRRQAARVTLTSRAFRNDQLPHFTRELTELTGIARVLPMNTGAEAVETAIKAARKWGYKVKGIPADKAEIIVCADNFHGRTTTIVGFSTEPQYKDGFGPFTPGLQGHPVRRRGRAGRGDHAEHLRLPGRAHPGRGRRRDAAAGYLKQAEEICSENNVLLIADEIQTGLGRTGKMFAHEWEGVKPDGLILGKALSGGFYPVSAVLADDEVMGLFKPGDHGSTFGGNPLGCAVAREALKVIVEEKLVEKSLEQGEHFWPS